MDSLEAQLIEAVRCGNIDAVQTLLDKGARVNYLPSRGKSALSTAAVLGSVPLIQVLLGAGKTEKPLKDDCSPRIKLENKPSSFDDDKENCNGCYQSVPPSEKQNLGYYIFVHNDDHSHGTYDSDRNRNENLDAETPDGMDGLEWDVEVEGFEEEDSDDVWSNQYRWYANILDKTGGITAGEDPECDVNLQDYIGRTAVHYAVEYCQTDTLRFLLASGCKPDVGDADNVTPLHIAAMRGHREIANLLISRGANVNSKTTDKMAALHYAAVRGFVFIVELLVQAGAAVDALDSNDRTPLMLAVTRDHYEVVELLISCGAKVNFEEIHGYTPLCEAVWKKSVEMTSLLLRSGAKMTQSPCLLHYAVLHRHTSMVELLLKNDAYVNLRDEGGDSPLLVAVGCGHLETIRILLLYGAIPNLPNSLTNITPLHKAIDLSHVRGRFDEILKLLCSYNVDLDFPGGGVVSTPLVHALLSHNLTCAVSLIRAGADVNKSGDTRCMWPAHRRFTLDYLNESDLDVAQLIVAAGFKLENYPLEYPKDFSNVPMDSFKGWLTHMKFSPRRLDDLCRLNIRRQLGNKALIEIPQMEIPHMLKRFLLFEDIYIKKRNRGLSEPREVSSFPLHYLNVLE